MVEDTAYEVETVALREALVIDSDAISVCNRVALVTFRVADDDIEKI